MGIVCSKLAPLLIHKKNGKTAHFIRTEEYVGKMTATKQHTATWERSTKRAIQKKNLSPQVHTADIPQDLRTHMDNRPD